MIEIAVDDKACVSCTLCVDICPTQVFEFNEQKGLPEVAKPKECFGCLSCSEICPADALDHKGVPMSQAFYHDPYVLELASKMATGAGPHFNVPSDAESRAKALEDLGVRLLAVAAVFKQTVGSGLPAVGALAGRTLARHLPRYRSPKSLDEALDLTEKQFAPAWKLAAKQADGKLTIEVKDCFVRELCQKHHLELGGEMCVLFYNCLAGYVGKMGGARLRLANADRGAEKCTYEATIHA